MFEKHSAAIPAFVRRVTSVAAATAVLGTSISVLGQQASATPESAADAAPAKQPIRMTPPTVDECLAAHREAQSLRKQLHLKESRELLSDCSHDACPGPVKRDCMRWIDDITVQMPSVVFRVDIGGDAPTSKVKIYVDNQLMFDALPGRAVEMNPGTYQFRFVRDTGEAVEQEVVLAEGEKFKNIAAHFQSANKPAEVVPPPGSTPAPPLTNEPVSTQTRPVPLATYIFAGVGAAAAINFGIWAIWSESLRSELKRDCAPTCEQEYVDRVRTRGYVADISLGVSVASFAGATILYFTRPTVTLPVKMNLGVLPNGGFAGTVLKEF